MKHRCWYGFTLEEKCVYMCLCAHMGGCTCQCPSKASVSVSLFSTSFDLFCLCVFGVLVEYTLPTICVCVCTHAEARGGLIWFFTLSYSLEMVSGSQKSEWSSCLFPHPCPWGYNSIWPCLAFCVGVGDLNWGPYTHSLSHPPSPSTLCFETGFLHWCWMKLTILARLIDLWLLGSSHLITLTPPPPSGARVTDMHCASQPLHGC